MFLLLRRARLGRLVHQTREDPVERAARFAHLLWVELDTEDELLATDELDGFHEPVIGPGGDQEAPRQTLDGLMMVRVDRDADSLY